MICPKCQTSLHDSARYCGCGWKKFARSGFEQVPEEQAHKCYLGDCFLTAKVKIKIAENWQNVCFKHYEQHYADEALANLDRYGMARLGDESTAEHTARMREFVRQGFKHFGKRSKTPDVTPKAA